MHIDELIEQVIADQHIDGTTNTVEMTLSDQWAQGRTLFGGVSAGLAYLVCKPLVSDDRVLRSYTVNFVGPIGFDTPFTIEARVLRSGKNVSQLYAQITQNDKVCLSAQACFGVGRESKVNLKNDEQHNLEAPKKAKFIPQIPKVTPRFLRHFDLAINEGGAHLWTVS